MLLPQFTRRCPLRAPAAASLLALVSCALAQVSVPVESVTPGISENTVDGIAAFVNGDAITISDVMGGVRMYINDAEWRAGRSRQEAFRDAYAEALGQLVNQRLIVQEYHAGEVRLPGWLIEKRLAEIIDNRFQGDRALLMRELGNERMTMEDWRRRIEEQMIVGAMRQANVDANVRVTPSQIRNHYEQNAVRYQQPAGVHLGLILLKALEQESEAALAERARAVSERLRAGEAFDAVARDVSDDPSAAKGGDWGWIVPEEMLRDELVQALDALAVGKVGDPVPTPAGVYLLRKIAERKASVRPLAEVREAIERELSGAESQRLFLAWLMRLRSKASIKTFGEWGGG